MICRHKTRQHIGQLVKDTSAKLKAASETDQHTEVSVSVMFVISFYHYQMQIMGFKAYFLFQWL